MWRWAEDNSGSIVLPGVVQTPQGIVQVVGIGGQLDHLRDVLTHPVFCFLETAFDDAHQLDSQKTGVIVPTARDGMTKGRM